MLVLIPVYNDWDSLRVLVPRIVDVLARAGEPSSILLIDDGSSDPPPADLLADRPDARRATRVLTLRRNLGHQRAISVALAHVFEKETDPIIAVMDGDGEDNPDDLPRLLEKFRASGSTQIVFAKRARRVESLSFRLCYQVYKALHLLLIGHRVEVGNFSLIPRPALDRLVVSPETWSHYAAAVMKLRLPIAMVPTVRGTRIAGRSKMNFFSLVTHGLAAMSVFGDVIGARLLAAVSGLIVIAVALIGVVIGVRLGTGQAIPGWATYTIGLLVTTLIQLVMLAVVFAFLILASRQNASFLPIRDHGYYIAGVRALGDGR
ncbi:MAG: glycosyltransferase [Planctomycetes bacterium]|nr:glycosyltransferase [Planctomycetota bacterium]